MVLFKKNKKFKKISVYIHYTENFSEKEEDLILRIWKKKKYHKMKLFATEESAKNVLIPGHGYRSWHETKLFGTFHFAISCIKMSEDMVA